MDCVECGVALPAEAAFCGHCGARLAPAPPGVGVADTVSNEDTGGRFSPCGTCGQSVSADLDRCPFCTGPTRPVTVSATDGDAERREYRGYLDSARQVPGRVILSDAGLDLRIGLNRHGPAPVDSCAERVDDRFLLHFSTRVFDFYPEDEPAFASALGIGAPEAEASLSEEPAPALQFAGIEIAGPPERLDGAGAGDFHEIRIPLSRVPAPEWRERFDDLGPELARIEDDAILLTIAPGSALGALDQVDTAIAKVNHACEEALEAAEQSQRQAEQVDLDLATWWEGRSP